MWYTDRADVKKPIAPSTMVSKLCGRVNEKGRNFWYVVPGLVQLNYDV